MKKERELARKDAEVKRAMAAMYHAQKQQDDALNRLCEKNLELYDFLKEISGKTEELVGRYVMILERAKEEYEYEPPSEYFKDGYLSASSPFNSARIFSGS